MDALAESFVPLGFEEPHEDEWGRSQTGEEDVTTTGKLEKKITKIFFANAMRRESHHGAQSQWI